jgi:NAD(P)-dependent dehydrogenase (short-subunit alcohol dehydrogenase family)
VVEGVAEVLADRDATVHHLGLDLADPTAPARLINAAVQAVGHLDMTSGQDLGPLRDEIAYATAKGALASITPTLADRVADQAITLNTINPGPVDTGYAPPDVHEQVRRHFPAHRWGVPDDPARLVAWLATDEAAWITGQVINTEGGFRRWGPGD